MMEEHIFQKLWLILPIWLVVYIADYYLTILGAYYYHAGAKDHIKFEGSYELTPTFIQDIDAFRMFSPKFFRWTLISSALIVILWYFARDDRFISFIYRFSVGGIIFQEAAILMRHARNIAVFRMGASHRGMSGQIQYERWLSYQMSGIELLSFAALFAFSFLFTGAISLLGAAVITTKTGIQHLRLSKKQPTNPGN